MLAGLEDFRKKQVLGTFTVLSCSYLLDFSHHRLLYDGVHYNDISRKIIFL